MLAKKIASIASGVVLCFAVSEGNAAEYAFTSYPLGVLAFGAGITPPPGIYVTDAFSFFRHASAGTLISAAASLMGGLRPIFFSTVRIFCLFRRESFWTAILARRSRCLRAMSIMTQAHRGPGAQSLRRPQAVAGAI